MAISSPSPSSLPFNIIKGGSGRAGSLQNTGKTQSEICWIAGVDARSPWDHAWIAPGSLAREGLTRRTTWAPSRKELKKLLSFLSSETAHKADELYKIWQKLEYLPMASLPHLKKNQKQPPSKPTGNHILRQRQSKGFLLSHCDPHRLNENSCWALDEKMPILSKPA